MPDYHTYFSEEIASLTLQEQSWCERFLDRLGGLVSLDFEYEFCDEGGDRTSLWLHGEESLSDTLIGFVQRFLARHRPGQYVVFSYANTCSRPLIGDFGGGRVFISADVVSWSNESLWLARQVAGHRRLRDGDALLAPANLDAVGAAVVTRRIWWFVVDTTGPAGAWYREMGAYLAGVPTQRSGGEGTMASGADPEIAWARDALAYPLDGEPSPYRCVASPGLVSDATDRSDRAGSVPSAAEGSQPSFQSVALAFGRPLREREVAQLGQRARAFIAHPRAVGEGSVIVGYRLLVEEVLESCIAVIPEPLDAEKA